MSQSRTYAIVSPTEAQQTPYPYIFVNDDGTVRELHQAERNYLQEAFAPSDGARPYVKTSFDDRNGWGSPKGFCHRSKVPPNLPIAAAPAEDPNPPMTRAEHIAWLKEKTVGFEVTEGPGGTIHAKRLERKPSE
jgi:hypothetical protein